jgi:hypothetical protein
MLQGEETVVGKERRVLVTIDGKNAAFVFGSV